jgi:PhnB protein
MADYKPAGFHSVTPYLVVPGADRLLQFLKDAFDAEEVGVYRKEDASIMHAELRIGDSIIEMGQANDKWTATPASLHLYVPDTDAVYHKALAAGAESLTEPTDAPYGDRTAGIKDPSGNHWFLATFKFR